MYHTSFRQYHIRQIIFTYHVSFVIYNCIMYQSSFVPYNISYDRSWNDIMPILTVFHFGRWHHHIIPLYTILYLYQTVGGRNPASLGSFSHYLQGSIYIPGGCLGFLPSKVGYESMKRIYRQLRRFASAQLEACSLFPRVSSGKSHPWKDALQKEVTGEGVEVDTNLRFKYDIYLTQPMVNL